MPRKITLPFNAESLRLVLVWGTAAATSDFSHQDIAHWCDRFHMAMFDIDTTRALDIATGIAADVDAQWDLFLSNTYDLEQLKKLDFNRVSLPADWFQDWLAQLEAA